jgi:GNAT superfamily N-acetyltransferase
MLQFLQHRLQSIMSTNVEIPPSSAFHFRLATMDDISSIVAAEHNCKGDATFGQLMHRPQPTTTTTNLPPTVQATIVESPQPTAEEEEAAAESEKEDKVDQLRKELFGDHVLSSDEDYVFTHMIDPDVQYVVIGYFRDEAERPPRSANGDIPMIDIPSAETIKSGKEHIVGFAQWKFVPGQSPADWDTAEEKARRARSPRMNLPLVEAAAGPRWQQRRIILGDRDYWSKIFSLCSKTELQKNADENVIALAELYIDARFQRRGLGSVLVKWGVEEGDKRGLPAYIEATAKGLGLYLKYGMKEVYRVDTDLSKYGGEPGQWHRYTLLYRDAKQQ